MPIGLISDSGKSVRHLNFPNSGQRPDNNRNGAGLVRPEGGGAPTHCKLSLPQKFLTSLVIQDRFGIPIRFHQIYPMIVLSENNPEQKKVETKINALSQVKGFEPGKYLGKVKWGQDPVAYQKDLRKRK
jgi:hypothetical protein